MKVYLRWINNKLVPSDIDQHKKLSKYKDGIEVECDIKRPRNLKFHKKYFALLNTVYEQQDTFENREHFRLEVQITAGHFEEYITQEGKLVYRPLSISFAQMGEDEFSELYNTVLDICINNYLPAGHTEDSINSMVEERLRFVG